MASAEHLVAYVELRYASAESFNMAGNIYAWSCVLWFAQTPHHWAGEQRLAPHKVKVSWIYRCRVNSYQDFIVLRRRFCHLDELQDIRWSVLSLYDRFHKALQVLFRRIMLRC